MQLKRRSTKPARRQLIGFFVWDTKMHEITDKSALLESLLKKRILILDGAMGTMIQAYKLSEDGYRGPAACGLHDHAHDLKGDNDLLVLTRPEIVREIHNEFLEAGADIIETNTFNATRIAQADYKLESRVHEINFAAAGIDSYFDEHSIRLPLIVSGTITDASGRTLSGQTPEAFWDSVRHAKPLAVGLNCALGAALMRPYIEEISRVADTFVSCYPNAGLPNPMSDTGYDETPAQTSRMLKDFAQSGFVNIVGGCCGTTPAHIRAIADAVRVLPPRPLPAEVAVA